MWEAAEMTGLTAVTSADGLGCVPGAVEEVESGGSGNGHEVVVCDGEDPRRCWMV